MLPACNKLSPIAAQQAHDSSVKEWEKEKNLTTLKGNFKLLDEASVGKKKRLIPAEHQLSIQHQSAEWNKMSRELVGHWEKDLHKA